MKLHSTVAWFFPAHNEEGNLASVVSLALNALAQAECYFQIIIVDDGSSDRTAAVAQMLVDRHPQQVKLIQHKHNRGYGAALRTGLAHGLSEGCDWIGFCDADGQFNAGDLVSLIAYAQDHGADIAIGHRIERADGLKRRLMGRGWHMVSRLILGFHALDVDCGFKVFSYDALSELEPRLIGDHATISPELLARANRAGHHVVEMGVNHYPRQSGEQSGANMRVVVGSLRGLLQVRKTVRKTPASERIAS